MSGALPLFGKGFAAAPSGVAGDTYTPYNVYRPYTPEAAGWSHSLIDQPPYASQTIAWAPEAPRQAFADPATTTHQTARDCGRYGAPARSLTKSSKRQVRAKSIREAAKRSSLDIKRAVSKFGKRLSTVFRLACECSLDDGDNVPPVQGHPRSEASSLELPRLSPVALGIPDDQIPSWIRENPESTTVYDDAVMVLDKPPQAKITHELEGSVLQTERRLLVSPAADSVINPEQPQDHVPTSSKVTASPENLHEFNTSRPVISRTLPANPSQTFDVILGPHGGNLGFSDSNHAIGLRDSPTGYAPCETLPTELSLAIAGTPEIQRSSTMKDESGTKPAYVALRTYTAFGQYHQQQKPWSAQMSGPGSVLDVDVDLPDFDAMEKAKNSKRRSRDLHFDLQQIRKTFSLPSGATIGGSHPKSPLEVLSVEVDDRLKRISNGFLQSGPTLDGLVEEVLGPVLNSIPEISTPHEADNTSSGKSDHAESKVSHASGHEGSTVEKPPSINDKVSEVSSILDRNALSPGELSSFNIAARFLNATEALVHAPTPSGDGSHQTSAERVEQSPEDDFHGELPRWSNRDYVDPASEYSRRRKRQRMNKRRRDQAAFETGVSRCVNPTLPSDVSSMEAVACESNVAGRGNDTQAGPVYYEDQYEDIKRRFALLRPIDIDDCTTR
jgi:hypothetical protein